MEDEEIEPSNLALFPKSNSSGNFQTSSSVSSVDTFLRDITRACLHTHSCNLPAGSHIAHSHTCYHKHTQVPPSEDDDLCAKNIEHSVSKLRRRRPLGNREAVRRYGEKKKAHTTYLEEEVNKLQLLNQQLVQKLQGQASLEEEFIRLRSLLLDFRGKIDTELAALPFRSRNCDTDTIIKDRVCKLQSSGRETGLIRCQADIPCFCQPTVGSSMHASGKEMASLGANCQLLVMDCQATPNEMANANVNA